MFASRWRAVGFRLPTITIHAAGHCTMPLLPYLKLCAGSIGRGRSGQSGMTSGSCRRERMQSGRVWKEGGDSCSLNQGDSVRRHHFLRLRSGRVTGLSANGIAAPGSRRRAVFLLLSSSRGVVTGRVIVVNLRRFWLLTRAARSCALHLPGCVLAVGLETRDLTRWSFGMISVYRECFRGGNAK